MSSSRQRRGEATRAEILNVARRLFSDFGYHNTGIADIQAATGLTKGAFYHHFRAKQELALGVLELVRDDYDACLIGPTRAEAKPGRRLAAFLDSLVILNERPEWRNCRLLATLTAEVTPADGPLLDAVRGLQDRILDELEQLIADTQPPGEAVAFAPDMAAQMVLSTLTGLVLARKLGVNRVEPADVVAQLKRALLGSDGGGADAEAESKRPSHSRVVRLPTDAELF